MIDLQIIRRHALLATAGTLAFALLAGCGGGGGTSPATGSLTDGYGGGGGTSPATGSLEGYVYTPKSSKATSRQRLAFSRQVPADADPVAGATVAVASAGLTTTTDSTGFFRLDNVPVGQQTLSVSKEGFATTELQVTVTAETVTRVNESSGGILLSTGTRAKWTVMVYMNADNDLEEFSIQDLNEMEQVGSTSDMNIVVEVDRRPGFDSTNGDWTGGRRYYITKDNDTQVIHSDLLADLGEIDMGDPDRLKSFISWAMTNYPADYYLLDLWDHGAGFRARNRQADPLTRGFSFDDTQDTYIKTADLPAALQAPDQIDILAWDASLMQMVEVADQVGDAAVIIVGSEESPPGDGYPYNTFLGDLAANPSLTPLGLAPRIVNDTIAALGTRYDVTQSALSTAKLPALRQALSAFADALTAAWSQYGTQIAQARDDAQEYGHDAFTFRDYKDIQDFAERVKESVDDSAVQSTADAVIQALSDALIAENHAGLSVRNSHGLSIYIPAPKDYQTDLRRTYEALHFAQTGTWDEFLDAQTK